MEKLSIESIEGDNYLPLHGRNYQPKPKVKPEDSAVELPDEWNDAVSQANEKDLKELAGLYVVAFFSAPTLNSFLHLVRPFNSSVARHTHTLSDLQDLFYILSAPRQSICICSTLI